MVRTRQCGQEAGVMGQKPKEMETRSTVSMEQVGELTQSREEKREAYGSQSSELGVR